MNPFELGRQLAKRADTSSVNEQSNVRMPRILPDVRNSSPRPPDKHVDPGELQLPPHTDMQLGDAHSYGSKLNFSVPKEVSRLLYNRVVNNHEPFLRSQAPSLPKQMVAGTKLPVSAEPYVSGLPEFRPMPELSSLPELVGESAGSAVPGLDALGLGRRLSQLQSRAWNGLTNMVRSR